LDVGKIEPLFKKYIHNIPKDTEMKSTGKFKIWQTLF